MLRKPVEQYPNTVIPAEAGIQCIPLYSKDWIPAFAGMTGFDTELTVAFLS
jgi:hypothetical protein